VEEERARKGAKEGNGEDREGEGRYGTPTFYPKVTPIAITDAI